MFESFTDRSRQAVVLAQKEARRLNHHCIGTEHLLLGLIHEEEAQAARVLAACGISLEAARSHVNEMVAPGDSSAPGHIPFTPQARKVLELAGSEALERKLNYTGTEHMLLGLIGEGDGIAAQVLASLGVAREVVEQRVDELGVTGTSERTPEEEACRMRVRVSGDRLEISVDDPELVRGLREMDVALSGFDQASPFPDLWKAVRATTPDLARRFESKPQWRAGGWRDQTLAG